MKHTMEYNKWIQQNWDILIGGIIPLIIFAVFMALQMLGILTGWVGLGVFGLTAWISMILSLTGLIASIWRGHGLINSRNLWFVPGLTIFALTIGANIVDDFFSR
jgi:hypothetical protein